MKYLMALLMLLPCVTANVVVSQIMYDPLSSEAGGEAVELKNYGTNAIDISGWVLATESSQKDVTFPDGSVLLPGDSYLIADEGWEENKETWWKPADHEEKMTLGNSDSGIALMNGEEIIDAVGWGDSAEINEGLFEGTPSEEAGAGMALIRTKDSDNNVEDFIVAQPSFEDGIIVPVIATIEITAQSLEVSKSLELSPEGVLMVKNHADIPVNVEFFMQDLWSKTSTVDSSSVSVVDDQPVRIEPHSEKEVRFVIETNNVVPGRYTSTLRVKYEFLE